MLTVIDHPLIKHKLTVMRKKDTGTKDFRQNLDEIGGLMVYEITRDLPLNPVEIETPICPYTGYELAKKVVIVPILRAGLGMVNGIQDLIPTAKIARWVSNRARHWTGIEIHPGAVIGRGLMIDHGMGVVIGETAIIGDDCQLYHGVTLGGTGKQHVKRHPTLEDGVYIGCGAKCLGNITLKKGCRVGANAVLLKDVPEGATAVGIPARIIEKK